jgi:hypothetical protein
MVAALKKAGAKEEEFTRYFKTGTRDGAAAFPLLWRQGYGFSSGRTGASRSFA